MRHDPMSLRPSPIEQLRIPIPYQLLSPFFLSLAVTIFPSYPLYGRPRSSASCNSSRDVEADQTGSDHENDAEDDYNTSFVASPVASLGELVTGIADLESRNCCHFEDCINMN